MFYELKLSDKTDEQLQDLLSEKYEQMNKFYNITPNHPMINQYKMLIAQIQDEITMRQILENTTTGTVLETGPYEGDANS